MPPLDDDELETIWRGRCAEPTGAKGDQRPDYLDPTAHALQAFRREQHRRGRPTTLRLLEPLAPGAYLSERRNAGEVLYSAGLGRLVRTAASSLPMSRQRTARFHALTDAQIVQAREGGQGSSRRRDRDSSNAKASRMPPRRF